MTAIIFVVFHNVRLMQRSMIIPLLSFLLMACGASSPKQSDTTISVRKVEFSPLSEKAKAYYTDAI
ncbi:hypothetical protein, partial [Enterococcus faecium]|uniref:hypothetical protein n=1 Tax=Enterococcus faecium TaxID=1352 RepID=UPI0034E954E6